MKMQSKRTGVAFIGFALIVLALCGSAEAARRLMVVGTAPAGTSSFPYMVGVAAIVNKSVPELALSPQETGGSVANIRLLDVGEIQLSGFSGMVAADALAGRAPFKKKRNVQVLFSMYQQRFLWFARKGSGIKSWDGVAGKKMAIGTPGGSTRVTGDLIVKAKGLKGKAKLLYLRPRALLDSMRDNNLDAGFGLATGPSLAPWVREAMATLNITIFGLDDATIAKLTKATPGLGRGVFPDDFFKGEKGFATLSEYLIAGVSAKLDEKSAYLITKAVQDNIKRLSRFSPAAKGLTPGDALKGVPSNVAFHPGALRYYREKGLTK